MRSVYAARRDRLARLVEEHLGDFGIFEKLAAAAFVTIGAGGEHVAAVAEGERLLGVLLDEQDGDTGVAHVAGDLEDLFHVLGRQAGGRLVEKEKFGVQHQRTPHRHHLALAAREVAGEVAALGLEVGEEPVDAVVGGGEVAAAQEGAHLEVLVHRHLAEHVVHLRHVADAAVHDAVGRPAGDVLAVEHDVATADGEQAEHGLHRGGLAGAVGADDDDDLALAHGDRHPVQDVGVAVAAAHVLHVEQRHHRSSRCSSCSRSSSTLGSCSAASRSTAVGVSPR